MKTEEIRKKFGNDYMADDNTFVMGIDLRFTTHFADRFKNLTVLETCTGAGFTTISLARVAHKVTTVEIDKSHQDQAIRNVEMAGLIGKVSFIHGSILDQTLLESLLSVDAAFIDPDWAVTGPNHVYRFIDSNTQPPADRILNKIFEFTENVAIVLPPFINVGELVGLPRHERESLFLGSSHELYCLYFGNLMKVKGATEFRVLD
jgi:hypothetical protein